MHISSEEHGGLLMVQRPTSPPLPRAGSSEVGGSTKDSLAGGGLPSSDSEASIRNPIASRRTSSGEIKAKRHTPPPQAQVSNPIFGSSIHDTQQPSARNPTSR